jgi:hypothetical protein
MREIARLHELLFGLNSGSATQLKAEHGALAMSADLARTAG